MAGRGAILYGDSLSRRHPLARRLVSGWVPLPGRGVGATLWDIAGRNHGTLTNGPTWTAGPNGMTAVSFDGSNDYVSTPLVLDGLAGLTVAAWLRCTGSGDQPVGTTDYTGNVVTAMLCAGGSPGAAYDGFAIYNAFGSGWYKTGIASTDVRGDGKWHLVAGTFDAGTMTYWVDGISVATASYAAGTLPASGSYPWQWGRYGAGGRYFGGPIGSGWIYDRALSASEMSSLYGQARRGYPDLIRRVPTATWFAPSAGGVSGSLAVALDALTCAGTGTVAVTGALAVTLADATCSAAATAPVAAAASNTLAACTLAGTATVAVAASASAALDAVTVAATAVAPVTAALTAMLGDCTGSGTGGTGGSGSLAGQLADATLAGSGAVLVAASLTVTLDAATCSAAGAVSVTAAGIPTLADVTCAGAGTAGVSAAASVALGGLTASATGTVRVAASLTVTLGTLTCSASGGEPVAVTPTRFGTWSAAARAGTWSAATRTGTWAVPARQATWSTGA